MTALEAIKARVNYPLTNSQAEEKLIARGVSPEAGYTSELAQSRAFLLAYADTLRLVLTMVNLSQGGSITAADRSDLRDIMNGIYRRYGEDATGASMIADVSDKW